MVSSKPAKAAAKEPSAEPEVEGVPPEEADVAEVPPIQESDVNGVTAAEEPVVSMEVDEPETPLSEPDEPLPALPRPMPRIRLRMPKASEERPIPHSTEISATNGAAATSRGDGEEGRIDEETLPTRPRRAVSRQQAAMPSAAARPVRSNARARAATKPAAAATAAPPVTRALRSRRGDRTEEEIQKEREKAEAIRAALDSEEDEDGVEESL